MNVLRELHVVPPQPCCVPVDTQETAREAFTPQTNIGKETSVKAGELQTLLIIAFFMTFNI